MAITLTLRKVTERDLDFLSKVYASTRYEELKATGWSQQQMDEFLMMQFEAQHQFYKEQFAEASFKIVQSDGQDAGRLYLDYRDDEVRIVDIALLPQFRGTGVGTRLLKNVIQDAIDKDLAVRIHVEKNNPALSLYQRLGFKQIGDRGVYWLMEKANGKQAA
jgi:ribosomal protein S18 acetylase RimI-like enzyme